MRRTIFLFLPLVAALACDGRPTTAAPEEQADDSELRADEGEDDHRRADRIDRLCSTLECTDDQRQRIEEIVTGLGGDGHRAGKHESDPSVRKAANEALAAAFRSESFGADALVAYRDAVANGKRRAPETFKQAIMQIHGILSQEQRSIAAQAIESRGLKFLNTGGHRSKHGNKRADHGPQGDVKSARGDRSVKKVEKLCSAIACSDEQRAALQALVGAGLPDKTAKRAEHRAANEALAAAFRARTLDEAALDAYFAAAPKRRSAGKDQLLVDIHALLTAQQRELLADRIAQDGPHGVLGRGGRGHKGHHRGGPKHGKQGPDELRTPVTGSDEPAG